MINDWLMHFTHGGNFIPYVSENDPYVIYMEDTKRLIIKHFGHL